MVMREFVVKHLEHLRSFLRDLIRYREGASREEFLRDRDKQNMALFALFESIQLCIDLGAHIISENGWRRPETYRDTFQTLWENGFLDEAMRDQLVDLAGFRNVVVHLYGRLDFERAFVILQSAPEALAGFAIRVEQLMEQE
jgi:uncharacterized protein YutE (UPF0331/DUF86 family)